MRCSDRDGRIRGPVVGAIAGLTLLPDAFAPLDLFGAAADAHTSSGEPGRPAIPRVIEGRSSVAAESRPPATHTSCRSVVCIGDSTSDGEALAAFVPDRRLRAPAQLSPVGVKTTRMEVSGARPIRQTTRETSSPEVKLQANFPTGIDTRQSHDDCFD
jgi:hypothetical protein